MSAFPLTEQDLRRIVAAASNLDERQSDVFLPDTPSIDDETITDRLNEWCRTLARGEQAQFLQRLAWAGLDLSSARCVLGGVRLREDASLPSWVATLQQALSMLAASPDTQQAGEKEEPGSLFLDLQEPLPFEEIIAPFVNVAQKQVETQAGAAYHLLCDQAHIALQRDLLRNLTTFSARALHLEFSVRCLEEQLPLEFQVATVQDHAERTYYHEFIAYMGSGGLLTFFQEYAVLARLLATTTDLWIEATVEFLCRLEADLPEIQRLFGGTNKLGRVVNIQTSLSDPHRGRRSVLSLTFASGCKIIYKPKDLGTEEAYQHLLAWLNEHSVPLPFKVFTVLNRSTHGWVEYVEQKPCESRMEARDYYRRAGILLCLLYVLEATDCHYENLIACGAYPVLVDMETLMHHQPRFEEEGHDIDAEMCALQQLTHSVLRSGLLPSWQVGYDKQSAYDLSGLGSFNEQDIPVEAVWEHVNTDHMRLVRRTITLSILGNQPCLDGVPLRVEEYAEDVIAGFQQMYRFLSNHRALLLVPGSPLQELARQQVRFLYRPTKVYSALLKRLLTPRYLRDGADRSIQLEMLGRGVLWIDETIRDTEMKPLRWRVFLAERQAMEQGDIPFFTAPANRKSLFVAPDQEIKDCLAEPGSDMVMARLRALNDQDCGVQVNLIQAALYTRVARDVTSQPRTPVDTTLVDKIHATLPEVSQAELTAQALVIAEQIASRAIRAADGSAAWIAPKFLAQTERYQLHTIGYDLYDGTGGVALFLAAVARVTGRADYGELARMAVQPLLRTVRRFGSRLTRDIGIGGTSGIGSIVYALTRMSHLLDEPDLLDGASQAACLITADHIYADQVLDISGGAAGALLGLLALYNASSDPAILDQAVLCGQHLLQEQVPSQTGQRTWKTIGGRLLTGFSHGAAGIAYALLRLYAVTQQTHFLAAASEGIGYESSLFVPEANNWPDLRQEPQPSFMTTWCHGAPGIGLARIGGLPMLDTSQIRTDIELALQTTRRLGLQSLDYLCCGNVGRVEVLLAAADRLSRPELAEDARCQVGQIVTQARQTGAFLLHPLLPKQIYCPGFFTGTAGIGYELLRVAYPTVLPSVLLWE
ncbi:type 2 lanthipeptide synthetase LanM family protein [Dictyobacter formicarum]|uniref:Lanthionine synthetase n=1 Tax=Dictyobacter formicarum TaxID=2778368 RepID=A0ABQ3VIE3_9CHLR|nr:type 2 lanthipeptide synthetase LanM family protein [Dictyobacter formicarum]GHO85588.1 lanthionine synthetase [Dictyobacter formicarum]